MKRFLEQKLIHWKNSPSRKPLLVRGARQVGKTYLINEFGHNEFTQVVYLNFEQQKSYSEIFKADLNPARIIKDLELTLQKKIIPNSTLLFFDEIQETPEVQTSLKYFCEGAPEFHVVAAGSLLGVKLKGSFPVGKVNFLDLFPLSFFEFLEALGYEHFSNALVGNFEFKSLPLPLHDQLMRLLREYFFVGGMPEAVASYVKDRNFEKVRLVQKEILKAYELDFAKHAPSLKVPKISAVWQSVSAQLARENKKFKFSDIAPNQRGHDYHDAIQWLSDAHLIHLCHAVSKPTLPLKHYEEKAFKIYLNDVGLLSAMNELSSNAIVHESKLLTEFKGALTENFVAQQFMNSGLERLHYWTSQNTAEIDFVRSIGDHAVPFEVKAGINSKSKSLKTYAENYKPLCTARLNALNFAVQGHLLNIPLYAAEIVAKLILSKFE